MRDTLSFFLGGYSPSSDSFLELLLSSPSSLMLDDTTVDGVCIKESSPSLFPQPPTTRPEACCCSSSSSKSRSSVARSIVIELSKTS